jgi:hypothetical protein
VTDAPGGPAAALKRASPRIWLRLGVMLVVGGVFGGLIALVAWAFAVTLEGTGDTVRSVLQVIGISLGESVWAALVTACGLDALGTAEGPDRAPDSG